MDFSKRPFCNLLLYIPVIRLPQKKNKKNLILLFYVFKMGLPINILFVSLFCLILKIPVPLINCRPNLFPPGAISIFT